MVINIGALKSGQNELVESDIKAVVDASDTLCSIVVGGEHRLILDVALVEHVERRQFDTTITIDVGQREEVVHGSDI